MFAEVCVSLSLSLCVCVFEDRESVEARGSVEE